jgi:plastocyanin
MRHPRSIALATCALGCVGLAQVATSAAAGHAHKPRQVVKKVKVADDFFSPTKLTIRKGQAVNWVWSSQNYSTHNVTLIKGPKSVRKKRFTSISGSSGIHFKRTFTVPGTYHFECTIHPGMNIAVTVKK